MTIETILEDFVSSKEPGAIVLRGPWGVGKTYLWQQRIVSKLLAKPWDKRYSYVSLFGINSLTELKTALAVATDEFDLDARKRRRLTAAPTRWFWRAWQWVSDALGLIPRSGTGLSKLFDRIGFYLVRDRIVCFDDIERHGKHLEIKDFLGLVSYLSEQRGCRIVVILNDGQLDAEDQKVWDAHREKVFQGELTYAPSPAQTIELGLAEDTTAPWHESLRSSLLELGISNIRLVRRAAKFMHLALASVDGRQLRPETIESMARTVAMLVFSVHGRGVGGPPLSRVQRTSRLDMAVFAGKGEDTRTEEEKEWDRLISDYRIYLHTDLDQALVAMVLSGFPDSQLMRAGVDAVESNAELYARKQAWHDAWRLYHDTVSDNGPEIVEAFERTWPGVSENEHATNLQSAARLLRMLGRPDLATSFIRNWVEQRSGARIHELDARELHLLRKIDDPEILAAIEQVRARPAQQLPVREAFNLMRESGGYPDDAIAALAAAPVEALIDVIDVTVAEDLTSTIRRVLELRSNHADPNWVGASQKMQQACEQISARSPLAADRMKNWFGIEMRRFGDEGQTSDESAL